MNQIELLYDQYIVQYGHSSPLLVILWTAFYLILANVLRKFSPKVMFHSIVHCMTSTALAGYVCTYSISAPLYSHIPAFLSHSSKHHKHHKKQTLTSYPPTNTSQIHVYYTYITVYIVSDGQLFTLDVYRILLKVDDSQKDLLKQVAYHSAGYFIGDTIDIKLDYKNEKRQEFVLHHLAALVGLTTVYFESYLSLYGLWLLETGGVVHHIKHAAHVFNWQPPFSTLAETMYHIIYLGTRLLLLGNSIKTSFNLGESTQMYLDIVCVSAVFVLVPQNLIWWVKNAKDSLKGVDIAGALDTPKKLD